MLTLVITLNSDVFRPFGRPVNRFGHPNSCTPQKYEIFFFQLYFKKKYVEEAISYFKMHLIISKWLRIQKCRQKRKTVRQRARSERRNCQRKCFHSFTYVIDHASIHFFFYVNSLFLLIPFVLLASYYKLRSLRSSHNLIVIHIFYLNI